MGLQTLGYKGNRQSRRPSRHDMDTISSIRLRLSEGLSPSALEIVDESGQHAGHAGHRPGEVTHVRVRITAAAFAGKSRIDIHRMVNGLLAAEFGAGLHALAIEAKAA
jgi:BolA family transcriptional regulator, general stress-responsive regulator